MDRSGDDRARRGQLAEHTFAQLGFGILDLNGVAASGDPRGEARLPVSHYGWCLRIASGAEFANAQSLFDAGFVAAAADFVAQASAVSDGKIVACQSLGAPEGRVALRPRAGAQRFRSPGLGGHSDGAEAEHDSWTQTYANDKLYEWFLQHSRK